MYFGLEYWAFEFYDQERHPALDCSPREACQRGLKESGTRPQRQILFNQDFLIATCPPADREGLRCVNRQSGVKVNNQLYWNPEFGNASIAGQRLPVRYDPWDASSVYVRFQNRWLQATCRNLVGLSQLTELERRALTEEYTQRSGTTIHDKGAKQRLLEFMQVFTPEGALAAAFERQQENKSLYRSLQLGSINPVAPLKKFSLTRELSSTAQSAAENRSSTSNHPPSLLPEATAQDAVPDFDTF